jgi:hypothetical protein
MADTHRSYGECPGFLTTSRNAAIVARGRRSAIPVIGFVGIGSASRRRRSVMSRSIPCALAWWSGPKDWPWSSARAHHAGRDHGVVTVAAVLEGVGPLAVFADEPFDEGADFAPRASCADDPTASRLATLVESP